MNRKTKAPVSVADYLGGSGALIKADNGDNLPLYIKFQFNPEDSPNEIQTDEAEALLPFDDGFGVLADASVVPSDWRLSDPNHEGLAMFKIPVEACIDAQHRKLRRRRYHNNVACRKYAA